MIGNPSVPDIGKFRHRCLQDFADRLFIGSHQVRIVLIRFGGSQHIKKHSENLLFSDIPVPVQKPAVPVRKRSGNWLRNANNNEWAHIQTVVTNSAPRSPPTQVLKAANPFSLSGVYDESHHPEQSPIQYLANHSGSFVATTYLITRVILIVFTG